MDIIRLDDSFMIRMTGRDKNIVGKAIEFFEIQR